MEFAYKNTDNEFFFSKKTEKQLLFTWNCSYVTINTGKLCFSLIRPVKKELAILENQLVILESVALWSLYLVLVHHPM